MSTAFSRWYERNKALYNQKRQQKYRQDAGFRETAIKRQKNYTQCRVEPMMKVLPDGREISVYRLGQLRHLNGASVVEVKIWEANGWIPQSQFGTQHRYYTIEQVELIGRFKEFLDEGGDYDEQRMAQWDELKTDIFNNWVR